MSGKHAAPTPAPVSTKRFVVTLNTDDSATIAAALRKLADLVEPWGEVWSERRIYKGNGAVLGRFEVRG